MSKTWSRKGLRASAVVVIGLLIAGMGVTAASATSTAPPGAGLCVPVDAVVGSDAVYKTVHHDAVPETLTTVHHEAVNHTEHLFAQWKWDHEVGLSDRTKDHIAPYSGDYSNSFGEWNTEHPAPKWKDAGWNADDLGQSSGFQDTGETRVVTDHKAYDEQVGNGDGVAAYDEQVLVTEAVEAVAAVHCAEVGLYIYQKLDGTKPAAWTNSGPQTFINFKTGSDWFTDYPGTLPGSVCGPGWAYQQDRVGKADFAWPSTITPPNNILSQTGFLEDFTHGNLSDLIDIPACPPEAQFATIIWKMNPVGSPPVFTPAQTIVDHTFTSSPELGAFDSLLTGKCVGFQVDVYKYTLPGDRTKVDALISGGVLNGHNNPAEPLIAGGLGTAWKFYQNSDCAQPVAVYPVFPEPTQPTCLADGALPSTPATAGGIQYAWDEDGKTLRATATEGHFIPEGTATTRTYEVGSATGYQTSNPQGACYKGQPDDIVVVGDWVAGPYRCGDTGVATTRETSTTTYVWMDDDWAAQTPVITVEHGTRALTEEEQANAGCGSVLNDTGITPLAPTPTPICMPNNDTITIPVDKGVKYTDTGWVNGKRTIKAIADGDFVLKGTTEWTFTDVPSAGCPKGVIGFAGNESGSKKLAFTGVSSNENGLIGLALALIISGTALVVRKVRED